MKVAFFSNYLNHHQLSFCKAMDRLTDHQFIFAAFTPTPGFRRQLGYQEMNDKYPFVLKVYDNTENMDAAIAVAASYDLLILGSAPEFFVKYRMKKNLLTLIYSERLYRGSIIYAFSPRGMIHRFRTHTIYARKKLYLLCSSAYTAFDYMLSGAYIGKAYKWGYFPQYIEYDLNELWRKKQRHSVLWVGRLINLKHPEQALRVADKLIRAGFQFNMNIIGSGDMKEELELMIRNKQMGNYVHLLGNMKPDEVRSYMETTEVFLFTSDFHEGWGAVLNEAMNSGCAVIASHAIGSVPYLIDDGKNGLIYKNGDVNQLFILTKKLLENSEICQKMGEMAYKTISVKWNAETAAKRMITLAEDLQNKGNCTQYKDGPCSHAKIINNWWYK